MRALEGMGVNRGFWPGRRVLVTGHTGFKGAWLTLWLRALGAEVFGYALAPNTQPSLYQAADVRLDAASTLADIRDFPSVYSAISDFKPEIVLHLAAQALVRASYQSPLETYSTNVMGTANLLEAVRTVGGVRAVVVVTSDKCYENREWVWGYREQDPMGGHDPYSSSKGCAELVTAAYASSYFASEKYSDHGVAIASARAGNVIGGGDWAQDRLLPDAVRAFHAGAPVSVRNPNAIRPWQYVLEPLRGYLMLAEQLITDGPEFAGAWNFGPADADARPVSWVVNRAATVWGEKASWVVDDSAQPHEAHYLKLDCSKARALLGWAPVFGLAEGLDSTVKWYREYYSGLNSVSADMGRALALREIDYYERQVGSNVS